MPSGVDCALPSNTAGTAQVGAAALVLTCLCAFAATGRAQPLGAEDSTEPETHPVSPAATIEGDLPASTVSPSDGTMGRSQEPPALVELGDSLAGAADIAELDMEFLLSVPVVRVASRRAQSLHEAPAAVTTITAAQLQAMPLLYPTDALRRVVGLDVYQAYPGAYTVGLRGYNGSANNRVPVLLDGQVMDEAWGFGDASWSLLALRLYDLERIEVIRGPGSTLYGANAFSGVIALGLRRPSQHPGLELGGLGSLYLTPAEDDSTVRPGEPRWKGQGHAAYGWVAADEALALRASVAVDAPMLYRTSVGIKTGRVSGGSELVRLAADLKLGDGFGLELDGSWAESLAPGYLILHPADKYLLERLVRLRLARTVGDRFGLSLQAGFRQLEQELAMGPSLALPLAIQLDSRARRWSTVLQVDLPLLSGRNLLSFGLDGQLRDERHMAGDRIRFTLLAALIQNELALVEDRRWLLSLGLRVEHNETRVEGGSEVSYEDLSPRAALIWRPQEDHDLRLSVARAFRTPAPFEGTVGGNLNLGSLLGGVFAGQGVVRALVPRPDLQPESVISTELGYRGRLLDRTLAELVLRYDRLRRLTYLNQDGRLPRYTAGDLDLDQVGLEASAELAVTRWFEAHAHYALTLTVESSNEAVEPGFPGHLLGVGLDARLQRGLRAHGAAHLARQASRMVLDYWRTGRERVDLLLVDARLGWTLPGWPLEIFLQGNNLLGWLEAGEGALQAPSSVGDELAATPIGTTVSLGLRLREEFP